MTFDIRYKHLAYLLKMWHQPTKIWDISKFLFSDMLIAIFSDFDLFTSNDSDLHYKQ